MKSTLAIAWFFVMFAGCTEDAEAPDPFADEGALGTASFEGTYTVTGPAGEETTNDSQIRFTVTDLWSNVMIAYESGIESHLELRGPGCDARDCANIFESNQGQGTDGEWMLDEMGPGVWTILLHKDGYLLASSQYTLTFTYETA